MYWQMSNVWNRYSRIVEKALDSLRWYQRTRPDALRHILAPTLVTLATLLFALVWGQPQLIVLAVFFVAAFMLLAGGLASELRDLETDVRAAAAVTPEIVPVLAQLAVKRPPEADVEPASAPVSEPQPLLPLPTLLVDEAQPTALALLAGPARTSESSAPPAIEHLASPESEDGPIHELRQPGVGPALHSCPSFLDACDFAFDYLEQSDPDELEIIRVSGESRMRVWSYSRSDAATTREIVEDPSASSAQIGRPRQP
jgi:hypothetical protein